MEKEELLKLRAFLRKALGAPTLNVASNATDGEIADVRLGERRIGEICLDDEDGDRSFSFSMRVPVGRETLQEYLRTLFENKALKIAGRLKKQDSVELSNGDEFLGILSADDARAATFTFQMAILDVDLEEI